MKAAILNILPFKEGTLPVKYLGVPLVPSRLVYRDCKELLEKVKKRINDWKNKFLSSAGRVQLVRSILSSMHIFWASVFILPIGIILDLEQMMRGFLWNQGELKRGCAKVARDDVCLPRSEGGIGIRRLGVFNIALITSHIWRLLAKKESLWVAWIYEHKLNGRSLWELPITSHISWAWRKNLHVRQVVRPFIRWQVGNGLTISAWFDSWCDSSPLANIISSRDIYGAGFQRSSKVCDIVMDNNWLWPQFWLTKYSVLGTNEVPQLTNSEDRMVWVNLNNEEKVFSVANVWEVLRPRSNVVDWHKVVWFPQMIPRHASNLWLILKCKLLTQDKLISWSVNQGNALICPLCETQPDTHEHLFFECGYARQVWDTLGQFMGFSQMPNNLEGIVFFLNLVAKAKSIRVVVAKLVFAAATYYVWQERNKRLFTKEKRTREQLVSVIKDMVRLKLATCRFRRTIIVIKMIKLWEVPSSCIQDCEDVK